MQGDDDRCGFLCPKPSTEQDQPHGTLAFRQDSLLHLLSLLRGFLCVSMSVSLFSCESYSIYSFREFFSSISFYLVLSFLLFCSLVLCTNSSHIFFSSSPDFFYLPLFFNKSFPVSLSHSPHFLSLFVLFFTLASHDRTPPNFFLMYYAS